MSPVSSRTSRPRLVALGAAAAVLLGTFAAASATAEPATSSNAGQPAGPIVIAHRGASGYFPEHTLAAYELAIKLGADFIEPDLVSTKDGVLVARHENEISGTTDVAAHPEFADRKATKVIDGVSVSGWFTEDFTLAELRTLRAKERIPQLRPGNTAFDGQFQVPTLQEVIDLAKKYSRGGREIGIYPETKHPSYFASVGLPLEERLVKVLKKNGLDSGRSPVFIQSFEVGNLIALNSLTKVRLVQLVSSAGAPYDLVAAGDPRTYSDLVTPAGLAGIAEYADGIGAEKNLIVPRDAAGALLQPTTLIDDAHAAGLIVHAWTFRAENSFLPTDFRVGTDPAAHGNLAADLTLFFSLGLDGAFSDFPDIANSARVRFTF